MNTPSSASEVRSQKGIDLFYGRVEFDFDSLATHNCNCIDQAPRRYTRLRELIKVDIISVIGSYLAAH